MTVPRNEWIDVLRALSAVAVVLFHFNVMPQSLPAGPLARTWHDCWQYGHLGVGVFFTLSGYCLISGWNRSRGFGEFFRRRIGRILPPYWCSLLLVAVIAVIAKLSTGVNDIAVLPHTAGSILATLLLLTAPVTSVPTVNWVYWTLSYLLAFYLLLGLPLLASAARRCEALAALHGLLCAVDLAFRPAATGILFFIRHWPVFGLGAALALWPVQRRAAGTMLAVSVVHACWTLGRQLDETHYVLVGWLTISVLVGTAARRLPVWLQPLTGLGRISYSVYLVHVPIGIYLLFRLLPGRFGTASGFIGGQLAVLAATLACARLFYLVAEKPFNPASGDAARP